MLVMSGAVAALPGPLMEGLQKMLSCLKSSVLRCQASDHDRSGQIEASRASAGSEAAAAGKEQLEQGSQCW